MSNKKKTAPAKTKKTPDVEMKTAFPLELHSCMGLNACKGHDRFGTNSCAGTGMCATAQAHSCHTNNNCRGQGGCGLYGNGEEQDNPANNPCAWQGSCAVPINAERFSTTGPNKGKSVWVRARVLFEQRMKSAKRQYGPSPEEFGPPAELLSKWINEETGNCGYTACGASGLSGGGSCS